MPHEQQTLTIVQAIELGMQHHSEGRLPEAENIYQQILQVSPNNAEALHLLGAIAYQSGKYDIAADLIAKSLHIKPEYAEAHYNLGLALKKLGRLPDAANHFHQATVLQPDYPDAHNNLGIALQDLGKLNEATNSYNTAINLDPDYFKAHYNLGNVRRKLGKLDMAINSFRTTITIKPDYPEAHNNLGNALQDCGKLNEAVASYQKAIALKPDYSEACYNLGIAYFDLGELDQAIYRYQKAITIQPDYPDAWNGLKIAAKALCAPTIEHDYKAVSYKDNLSQFARDSTSFAMIEYYLDRFRPDKFNQFPEKVMAALPSKTQEQISIQNGSDGLVNPPRLSEKMVALLHFGRSGTGLLHSLIDNHPEVSSLPSIYLRGFFNDDVWRTISTEGWQKLPERFVDEFTVLFDARSPKLTPGMFKKDSPNLGYEEGMTTVGENRDEVLSIDRDEFCNEARRLMSRLDSIDPGSFIQIAHRAFEHVMGTKNHKNTIFYHIHNPDDFAKLNFLRYYPNARFVMMVREPIQSCESWLSLPFRDNKYRYMVNQIIAMLFAIDQIAFRIHDSIAIRLEDLKNTPEESMQGLCRWMGIQDDPTLYQMTAQGKKWWGDPSSPDYDVTKAMLPFGPSPTTTRKTGTIFSDNDQFILRTLFYPFNVRFGYCEADPAGFKRDLKEIRPLFDSMFNFEKAIAEKSGIEPSQFMNSGAYLFLRAGIMDRWRVLDEFGDYPHMIQPMKISSPH